MSISMRAVVSSNIAAVGYDSTARTLVVTFKTGAVYHYADVPHEVYVGLYEAESPGACLKANVVGKFKYTRIAAEKEAA